MEHIQDVVQRQKRHTPRTFTPQPLPDDGWQYGCDRCQDRGWIPIHVYDAGQYIGEETGVCDCHAGQSYRKRQQEKLFSVSTIPPDYLQYDNWLHWTGLAPQLLQGKLGAVLALRGLLDNFGHAYCLSDLHEKFAGEDFPRYGVVIYGDNGVGKTALVSTLATLAMTNNIPTLFVYLLDFLDDIKGTFKQNYRGPSADELIRSAKTAQLLVVDEFNKANLSPYDLEVVEKIIRHRYRLRLPVVVTTNLTDKADMSELWGRQIVSALAEMCHFVWMGGAPLRNEANTSGARF